MEPILFDRDLDEGWTIVRAHDPADTGLTVAGYCDDAGTGLDMRVLPRTGITVIVDFGDEAFDIETDAGRRLSRGVVAGMMPGRSRIRSGGICCVEVRLSPLRTYPLLGPSFSQLIDLEDVWGTKGEGLRDHLASLPTWRERFELIGGFLTPRRSRVPDPEVVASWNLLVSHAGRIRVRDLADRCGWSTKRLRSRFTSQIGIPPKRAAMLVRFDRAATALASGRPPVEVATRFGYFDQSHLNRDLQAFAGLTPGTLAG